MGSLPAVEDLSIQEMLNSNTFDIVLVYMLYVKDLQGFSSQTDRPKTKAN